MDPIYLIPIIYKRAALISLPAKFDTIECIANGEVTVKGEVSIGGGVFCGTELVDGSLVGDYLKVDGGSVEYLDGWSGDIGEGTFRLKHDGVSAAIVVTYAGRYD